MKHLRLAAFLLPLVGLSLAQAGTIAKNNPLVGIWRVDVPGYNCSETYVVRDDGTLKVSSGEEVSESDLSISDKPGATGFYRWEDNLVKDNGKKDCTGEVMQVGTRSVTFIYMKDTGDQFMMCREENLNACVGPFVRFADENT